MNTPYNLKVAINMQETVELRQTLANKLATMIILPEKILVNKLSCGSTNPPANIIDYYHRMVSILKKIVENPSGVNKISKKYKTKKKNVVKPPTIKNASRNKIRIMLKLLESAELVNKSEKGYYTSKKGKDFLLNKL